MLFSSVDQYHPSMRVKVVGIVFVIADSRQSWYLYVLPLAVKTDRKL